MSRMNDDELRAALSRRDPAAGQPVGAATSPQARALWERIMSTPVDEHIAAARTTVPSRPRRRMAIVAAVAALVTSIGVTAAVIGPSETPDRTPPPAAQVMTLRTQGAGVAGSCAMFDIGFLQRMPVAFQGKVVEVDETSTVLQVDRWFRGGADDVTTVRVSTPGPETSESAYFSKGETYLVSAQDGVVTDCGYSGGLTPEFLAVFEKAFGAR